MTITEKVAISQQITTKLEKISASTTSFNDQEQSDILGSATALASDTTITTNTLMNSLVTTVANVVDKVKITNEK